MPVKIVVRDNGPLRVEFAKGECLIEDQNGNAFNLGEKSAVSLCRCGASANKPYCDGAHSRCGFESVMVVNKG